ncbi:hypothetical protein CRUP_013813, partial [Coryphaenoides rupestris]
MDKVKVHRGIMESKLYRANAEMTLLRDKVKIQESVLLKSSIKHNEGLEVNRRVKIDVADLIREKDLREREAYDAESLKLKLDRTEWQLEQERKRNDVMDQRTKKPLNSHPLRSQEHVKAEITDLNTQLKVK